MNELNWRVATLAGGYHINGIVPNSAVHKIKEMSLQLTSNASPKCTLCHVNSTTHFDDKASALIFLVRIHMRMQSKNMLLHEVVLRQNSHNWIFLQFAKYGTVNTNLIMLERKREREREK